ncbi:hypothetical protein ACES2I_10430 [Bdellovibrio bacteriovorus]|uniref:hypothetical protein n=1 Tax=Bdellovibrio bacteriovorus TaxID=959 RepID=UPI0035A65BFC
MNMRNVIRNQKGQTIVEAIVGFGLITMVGLTFVGGMVSLRNTTKNTLLLSSTDKQVNDIAENIKSGVENYQINYDSDRSVSELLNPDTLPMAWDNGKVALRKDCSTCAGTYGYVIQPYPEFRGLYKVTLRVTHKSWIEKGEAFKDYHFVVSAK